MLDSSKYEGTQIQSVLEGMDAVYAHIDEAQADWKRATPAPCPDGCGQCCVGFEPEIGDAEVQYLAAWLLEHQSEVARQIVSGEFSVRPGVRDDGCIFFDPDSAYHCTVYGGRALICRLFGYCGDHGKDGRLRWKPCKFNANVPESAAVQYSAETMQRCFGALPPDMAAVSAHVEALVPGGNGNVKPLREAVPEALAKLRLVLRFLTGPGFDSPEPEPNAPQPLAS
ncbi:YkgJ family cysteine cluster protein [Treponema brennaborense]|uniref:YkgJ family cysteine cluster protein n=1 Tax=Treponema brennaborense (strain DSM 12168 / CIP 105900 / DD5/3) TaxID=906968 RepID=F4LKB5_TREBD|nr:YkgJ family cysteine cluster protein [Treponema brennaborense]AEE16489.1 protein of unknown function UPF0153 [Treponema brennaborense DSM 12168]